MNGGHKLGPIVPWVTLEFVSNNESKHKVAGDLNLVYEKDVNVGGNAVYDVSKKEVTKA